MSVLLLALAVSLNAAPPSWDGLSSLHSALGRAAPRLVEGGDLGALDGDWALVIVDPVVIEDPRLILNAVKAGARALLLVESDGPLLNALGLSARPAPEGASALHPALFPVTITTLSPALQGQGAPLLANHAVALAGLEHLRPAAQLQGGRPFAYHLKVGRGEVFVCGDSSLFIDLMLRHPPNVAAVGELLAWLTEGGARPVHLLSDGVEVYAPPTNQGRLARLNALLRRLSSAPPPALFIEIFIALLALPLALAALLLFRARRGAPRPRQESTAASRRGGVEGP